MNRYGVEDEDAEDAWITERREADKLRAEVRELKRRIAKARDILKGPAEFDFNNGTSARAFKALAAPRRKR